MKNQNLLAVFALGTVLAAACKDSGPPPPSVSLAAGDDNISIPVGATEDVVVYLESRFTEFGPVIVRAAPLNEEFDAELEVTPEEAEIASVPASHVIAITCLSEGTNTVVVSAAEKEEDGRSLVSASIFVNCIPAATSGNGGNGGNGGGGNGGGGNGGGGNGGGGNGGGGNETDAVNDCMNGTCDPQMDITSVDLSCDSGAPTALLTFAEPMTPMAAGESSRLMYVYTQNEEHRLQATAFASEYTCGYRVNFSPTPIPAGTVCEVDAQGRMSFSLPASAFSEPVIDVVFESTYYDGMSIVIDEAGPFPTCQ